MAKRKNETGLNVDSPSAQYDSMSLGDPTLDPDVSDDELGIHTSDGEDTSKHKEYTVQRDGTVINGELLNQGDVVTLHPDAAAVLMSADVRLTEVPPSI